VRCPNEYPAHQQGRRAAQPAGALPRRAGVRLPGGQDTRGGVSSWLHVAEPAAGLLRVRRRGSRRLAQGVPAACSLMSSIHDQSEFLIYDESVCSRLRVDHSSRRQHPLIPRTRQALYPAVGLLVCLRKRECSESCAERVLCGAECSPTRRILRCTCTLVLYL
jgi:hypothetical protein